MLPSDKMISSLYSHCTRYEPEKKQQNQILQAPLFIRCLKEYDTTLDVYVHSSCIQLAPAPHRCVFHALRSFRHDASMRIRGCIVWTHRDGTQRKSQRMKNASVRGWPHHTDMLYGNIRHLTIFTCGLPITSCLNHRYPYISC